MEVAVQHRVVISGGVARTVRLAQRGGTRSRAFTRSRFSVATSGVVASVALFFVLQLLSHSHRGEALSGTSTSRTIASAGAALPNGQLWMRGLSQKRQEIARKTAFLSKIITAHGMGRMESRILARSIISNAKSAEFDPLLVAAVVKRESTFRTNAVSHRGAIGLMQVMPRTGQYVSGHLEIPWSGAHKLSDPTLNLRLGIAYLQKLIQQYNGDLKLALIAYNWGPGNLSKALRNKSTIPSSPVLYAERIISDHQQLRKGFGHQLAQRAIEPTSTSIG